MSISKQAFGVVLLAGIVGMASGQEYELRIEGGPEHVDLSGGSATITLDVIGDIFESQGREYMLWGSFSLDVSGSAQVESIIWSPAEWSEFNIDGGYDGSGHYNEIEFGQWQWDDWTPRAGSAMGSRIGSFQITLAQQDAGFGDFNVALGHGTEHTLGSINVDTGASYYSTPDTLTFQDFSTRVTPAPSVLSLGVIGGLLSSRRKRSL